MTAKKKPSATTNFSDQYKDPRWQKKRLEIMERDEFTCKGCGDMESTLNVHHSYYLKGNKVWDYQNWMLVTLCEKCHQRFHKQIDMIKEAIVDGLINNDTIPFDFLTHTSELLFTRGIEDQFTKLATDILGNICELAHLNDCKGE